MRTLNPLRQEEKYSLPCYFQEVFFSQFLSKLFKDAGLAKSDC